jgi:putative transposase
VRRIEAFVASYNATARPFAWTATPESILAKLERLLKAISGTQHRVVRGTRTSDS